MSKFKFRKQSKINSINTFAKDSSTVSGDIQNIPKKLVLSFCIGKKVAYFNENDDEEMNEAGPSLER